MVEELPGDRAAVYVPMTPAATFGQVYIVASTQVDPLEVPVGELMGPVTEWAAGTARLLARADGSREKES